MTQKKRGLNKGLHALLAETIGLGGNPAGQNRTVTSPQLAVAKANSNEPELAAGNRKVVATAPLASMVANPAPTNVKPAEASPTIKASTELKLSEGGFGYLAIDKLSPGRFQPRRTINEAELEELAASIKSQGVLQPIVVRPISAHQYEIIAGERRWRASKLAGLLRVPVVVKDLSDEDACAIGLIENIQRQALNPMEEAIGIDRLIKQFDLTHAEVATAVGKSRTSITNLLRLLNLQEDVKKMLEQGEIDHGHAKVLLAVSGSRQSQIARQVADKQLSVRETEDMVNNQVINQKSETRSTRPLDPDIKRLQRNLSEKLGAIVKIQHTTKGRGKLIINYDSLESLDGILAYLK